jgi:hypothetical protein
MTSLDRTRTPLRWGRALELAALLILCFLSVRHWAGRLNLSPDSTTYITAAGNLAQTGRLFYFANAASWSMEPEVEPYTEQPPGFVYFLAPFIGIVREPINAALIAQGVAILAFYVSLFVMFGRLRFHPALGILGLATFAFLAPFVQIRSFLWSETLFIAASVAGGWIALRIVCESGPRSDWLLLLAFLAFSSAVRLVGVANVAWIFPILLRRRTLRAGVRLLTHPALGWTLALGGLGVVVVFLFADRLGLGTRGGIGPTQILGIVLGTAAVVLGVGVLVSVRNSRIRPWAAPADAGTGGEELWPWAAMIASTLPVLLWFARNEILYGAFSLTNKPFEVFHAEHLGVPFAYFANETLGMRNIPAAAVALAVLGLMALPFFVGNRERRLAQACILAAALAQFAAVWLPSLASEISSLGHRLLAPSIALLALATFHGLQAGMDAIPRRKWAPAMLLLPLSFLALGRNVAASELLLIPGGINYPVERNLWQDLHELEWTRSSTHFYSDRDFVHQVFAGIPQRIIWDNSVLRDPGAVAAFLGRGENPFFLLREGIWEAGRLEEMMASGQVPLEKIDFSRYGFVLYRGTE